MHLARRLAAAGREVVIVSRSAPVEGGPWRHEAWDGRTVGAWARALDGASGLVNLAGRSVDCVKSPPNRDEILRSRVESTRALGAAVRGLTAAPPVWVQMSTAHIYGDPAEVVCDEDAALGHGLAPDVGRAWEAAFDEAAPPSMRRVVLRTSFVLGRGGGALPRLAGLARWGLGGRVGSGSQGISWIHEEDMGRLFERALGEESMRGVYIATAPRPVSNAEFMRALRGALRRPFGLPTPGWMVRLGAATVLRTDPELALYGRYCVSKRLAAEGFAFRFPELSGALEDLFGADRSR